MMIEIRKAVIDGYTLKDEEINFSVVMEILSQKVDKLVIDETKKEKIPEIFVAMIKQMNSESIFVLGGSNKKEYIIENGSDLRDYLFEQYAFYHLKKDNCATFKIDEKNYIELEFK